MIRHRSEQQQDRNTETRGSVHFASKITLDGPRSDCNRIDTFSTSCITRSTFSPAIFSHVVLLVTAAQQLRDERRVFRNILEALGNHREAIEIAAEADVIDAGNLADVIDVICRLRQRRAGAGCAAVHSSTPA